VKREPPDALGMVLATEAFDAGLAIERTFLAWNRMALAFMAAGGALLKLFPSMVASGARHFVGFSVLAFGGVLLGYSYPHYMMRRRVLAEGCPVTALGLVRVVALGTTALGAIAFILGLLPSPQ